MGLFTKILVLVDPHDSKPGVALVRAAEAARLHNATLAVAVILPELPNSFDVAKWQLSAEAITDNLKSNVEHRVKKLLHSAGLTSPIDIHIRFGTLFLETIQLVLRDEFDLVIKQAESPNWLDHLFDSDDMHLLRKCPSPVWLLNPQQREGFQRVAVAVDVNDEEQTHQLNKRLVSLGAIMAKQHEAQLDLIHVYNSSLADFASMWADNPEKLQESMLEECRLNAKAELRGLIDSLYSEHKEFADGRVKVNYHLVQGIPEKHIAATLLSLQSDLLVMGTIGRTGIKGMIIGNTAEAVLMQIQCSVIAVKPHGFTSPVS